jgi:threonine/homoserine/homoserine lactone efflux protein
MGIETLLAFTAAWALLVVLALIGLAGRLRTLVAAPAVRARVERLTGTVFVVLGTRLAGASR